VTPTSHENNLELVSILVERAVFRVRLENIFMPN
jgi:hypothetical protein